MHISSKKNNKSKEIDKQSSMNPTKKKLTSRQRKALTKILEKKQKSFKRSEMLNELKSLELSATSLSLMTSISQTQTTGLRNAVNKKKKSSKTSEKCDSKIVENEEDAHIESQNI
ncbi:uncharacterized protein LOC126895207 isoform X2 [Daktulosphaira vitifoliae]|uniref:uncharacterized protein LOC126895207 isoform X2 n=1 Tax=Daktulosphaira vitifoliae TaxID=58002 RepID=UPI0021AA5047|nr:uncharacterized protein LOC126895207 isoform X2 [Daktulosphaira vitifoliae]